MQSSGRSSTNARATGTEPTVDAQPKTSTEPKVDTTKAPGSKPADAKASGTKPADSKASGTKTTGTKTTGTKMTGTKMTGTRTTGGGKPAGRPAGSKPSGKPANRPANRGPAQQRPARKKKSIVNQKQRPWGLIIAAVVVVAFAAAVVGVVVATHKSGSSGTATKGGQAVSSGDPYRQAELPAAAAISGVSYRVEGQHNHVEGKIKYDSTPPVGGNHSQYWADCTGTVYSKAIANENAVHMLEHGAIWITYDKSKLSAAQVSTLAKNVSGIDRMAMSPYPNLKSPISLQAWGYQLFLNSPTDPRIAQFIKALKYNQKTTPEYGATCSQPTFKSHPSTFGNPLWEPKGGASGNVGGM
ncbi:DUF3105 domain-containing protein [uncultured Jatrophihabitans sp.]|uniref:DUF3105 domain-containing protein n=1 Tax=uncultured Jatrophihabitans sp. TaxID=1610747 RepID=UPI0035CAAA67